MTSTFNPEEFERLSGRSLGMYASQIAAGGDVPTDFVDYFAENSASWDGQQLEAALSMLATLDSESAQHHVADFVDHPIDFIRLLVIRLLDQPEAPDGYVLSKVESRLSETSDETELRGLTRILERARGRRRGRP